MAKKYISQSKLSRRAEHGKIISIKAILGLHDIVWLYHVVVRLNSTRRDQAVQSLHDGGLTVVLFGAFSPCVR